MLLRVYFVNRRVNNMVKSMTGYGRAEETFNGCTITVELRSVNNRYLDCNVRIPRLYLFAEEAIKARVITIARDKVSHRLQVFIRVTTIK